jgi:hypothetical protein
MIVLGSKGDFVEVVKGSEQPEDEGYEFDIARGLARQEGARCLTTFQPLARTLLGQ